MCTLYSALLIVRSWRGLTVAPEILFSAVMQVCFFLPAALPTGLRMIGVVVVVLVLLVVL